MDDIPQSSTVSTIRVGADFEIYRIDHPRCQALIARQGAQVLEWTTSTGDPILYRSSLAALERGRPVRAGVPICWPWFANHPTDSSLPLHGFVRTLDWSLDSVRESEPGVAMTFIFESTPETMELWPHRFRLEARIELGAELTVGLRAINTGTRPFMMGGALHTYLAVGDLADVHIEGLEGFDHLDKTTGMCVAASYDALRFFGEEIDRIYDTPGPVSVIDRSRGQKTLVENRGNTATVIWNPGRLNADQIDDIGTGEADHFIAVEPAIPGGHEVEVSPGSYHVLLTRISLA
ncbi:D-hexose-6-phosphate mutarotase [Luteolibacter flavescens]|uniref:Putative glucose-6-phosphate 1-epimerase n=1 Tax=Luteolibacter flavescens TaxID=1859460 RepID=A0ABT3FR39_9BACT|nr:D-hexose-6-phosphate mutarotase [Luteolibacter flavescens]MCW1886022.1 D-hexose-6-phosphate mutarotase [Luteolibacter flavescens]